MTGAGASLPDVVGRGAAAPLPPPAAAAASLLVDKSTLEALLGFHVNNPLLYQQAFVHKSAMRLCEERGLPVESYELYEFLGDAAINLVVTKYVFDQARRRGEQEGWATKMRTRLVSGQCLSKLARSLGLQDLIFMNAKAMSNGWNHNDRILEDCFEALVGCIYLDVSLVAARTFVLSTIEKFINLDSLETDNNYKDIIMRWAQAKSMPLPVYKHIEAIQNDSKVFVTHCFINGHAMGYGRHKSKKQGEQMAAKQAMCMLDCGAAAYSSALLTQLDSPPRCALLRPAAVYAAPIARGSGKSSSVRGQQQPGGRLAPAAGRRHLL